MSSDFPALIQTYFASSTACVPHNLLTNLPMTSTAWVVDICTPVLKHVTPTLAASLQRKYRAPHVKWQSVLEHQLDTGKDAQ